MTSMFSFGFSGDDIEDDGDGEANTADTHQEYNIEQSNDGNNNNNLPEIFPAEKHSLAEWTSCLPSQIAYNTLKLPATPVGQPHSLSLGRREIFDVRTQLMAEDAPDHEELISGLEQGDLKPNFYEGGFKTWECALDLASLVLGQPQNLLSTTQDQLLDGDGQGERVNHVVELGCGTAVPSLALFARLLSRPVPDAAATGSDQPQEKKIVYRFTLADYNSTVLRMVTLPNLLLTWWLSPTRRTSHSEGTEQPPEEGELDIDSALIDAFLSDLARRGIALDLISGGWSPRFVDLVLDTHDHLSSSTGTTLVLASETIYAPSSLGAFSETVVQLLRRAAPQTYGRTSRALVAAKRVYFGVGGGIDEFLHVLRQQQLLQHEQLDTRETSQVTSEGVGRVILEISFRNTSTST